MKILKVFYWSCILQKQEFILYQPIYIGFFFVFSRSDTSNPYSFKGVYNLNIAEMGNLISGAMQ